MLDICFLQDVFLPSNEDPLEAMFNCDITSDSFDCVLFNYHIFELDSCANESIPNFPSEFDLNIFGSSYIGVF